MTHCDVSVVIPAYNAEAFITDALASIAAQTQPPKEVFVIDDGSRDQTSRCVQNWIAASNPSFIVKLIRQENCGLPATRNVGMRKASGEWIALLDADDIWQPRHLEELILAIRLIPGCVAAYGAGRVFAAEELNSKLYDDFWDNPSRQFGTAIDGSNCLRIGKNIFPRLVRGNFIKPSSLMFRADVANEIGYFDEELRTGEDREFLVRLIFRGDFIYFPESITLYRWHEDNISQSKNAQRNLENSLRVLDKIVRNQSLQLEASQLRACRLEIGAAITSYLYVCSLSGWRAYVNGLSIVRTLFGKWSAVRGLNLKHFARTLTA